jgi:adenosylmethionine-8-amino-7-oxononanoate aminotransferase
MYHNNRHNYTPYTEYTHYNTYDAYIFDTHILSEVRGWGLINGIEITEDSGITAAMVTKALMDNGLLVVPAGLQVGKYINTHTNMQKPCPKYCLYICPKYICPKPFPKYIYTSIHLYI